MNPNTRCLLALASALGLSGCFDNPAPMSTCGEGVHVELDQNFCVYELGSTMSLEALQVSRSAIRETGFRCPAHVPVLIEYSDEVCFCAQRQLDDLEILRKVRRMARGAVCQPGQDQTCNHDPAMSALAGVCEGDATCACGEGMQWIYETGRCAPIGEPTNKVDVLLVMDNSSSMCEEQDRFSESLERLSGWLIDEMRGAVDLRFAVTSTDMHPDHGEAGLLLAKPALEPSINCRDADGQPYDFGMDACRALIEAGQLDPILRVGPNANVGQRCEPSDLDCVREDIALKMRCLATLGTGGDSFEKGLEAMHQSLSCSGPNAPRFGQCCVSERVCSTVADCGADQACVGGLCRGCEANEEGCVYDPTCTTSPEFLRPDAALAVVILSDEDDCSDPAVSPDLSAEGICRYGRIVGGDGGSSFVCESDNPLDCFIEGCGEMSAVECYYARCAVSRASNDSCEHSREMLVPVFMYADALRGLKARPEEQIIVMSVVGHSMYTEGGDEIAFNPGVTSAGCEGLSPGDAPAPYTPERPLDECCPEGQCLGSLEPSCASSTGVAFAGRRYNELARAFGDAGLGCAQEVTPASGEPYPEGCTSICSEDYYGAAERLISAIQERLSLE